MPNPVPAVSHLEQLLTTFQPHLRRAERGGLALWVVGLLWHWERTRRTDPDRIARHWLVLAIATVVDVAVGTRLEEADWRGVPPGQLRRPRTPPPPRARRTSVFARGLARLHVQVLRGTRWWRALWLLPEALPDLPPGLTLMRHATPPGGAHA